MKEEIYREVNDNMYLRRNDADQGGKEEEGGGRGREKGRSVVRQKIVKFVLLCGTSEIKSGLKSLCAV